VARSFFAALDEGRWIDAAALVHPQTREEFKRWWVDHLHRERLAPPPEGEPETVFASPASLLGTSDAAEAARLPAEEILARFAEAVQPGNLHRAFPGRHAFGADEQIRVTRTVLHSAPGTSGSFLVRYRTEWWHGEIRNQATAGIHVLELARFNDEWRVRDADLGGFGNGHILPQRMA
jgi:hypothetical protein